MKTILRTETMFLALVLSATTLAQAGETATKKQLPNNGKNDRHATHEKVSNNTTTIRTGFSPAPYGGGLAQFLHY